MLVAGTGLHAMLSDMVEMTRAHKDLALDVRRYQVHASEFCAIAKSTAAGWRRCVRCQNAAAFKARRIGQYIGACHLGLNEIVYPLKVGGKLIGIIFVGQGHFEGMRRLPTAVLKRKALHLGINWRKLRMASGKIPLASAETVERLICQVEVVGKFVNAYVKDLRGRPQGWSHMRRPVMSEAPHSTGHARERWLAEQGAEIAKREYHKPLTTAGVASRLHAPLSVFCHAFKRETGQPFRMFVLLNRIEAAKLLLRKPGFRISDIALEVGFREFSYFSRVFARLVGHSPLKYRNMVISSRDKRLPQTKSNY